MPRGYLGRESTALHRRALVALMLCAPVVLARQDTPTKKTTHFRVPRQNEAARLTVN